MGGRNKAVTAVLSSRSGVNPYVGPRPFERGQRLYGRDREVARLRDLLIAERIVLLYSPSGAGKTSLIRAGLAQELEREGFRVLPEIRVAGAGLASDDGTVNRYLMSTLLCLEKRLPPQAQRDPAELAGMGLTDYLDQTGGEHDDVLIFDQFEELLVADPTDQDAKAAFVTELGAALADRRRWAVFAMREDLVAGLDPYRRLLPTRLRTTFRLDLLGEAAARMAMQRPALDAGVEFAARAARELVDSLRQVRVRRLGRSVSVQGPYVEPVQLQVVCERLWERLGPDAVCITEADVGEVGDIDRALAGYYAGKVAAVALQTGADERAIRAWFEQALIAEQGLRVPALAGPLDGEAEDETVLGLLQDAHLVRAETRGATRWFELAHDRLIEPVRTSNAEWFEANLHWCQRQAPLWQREFRPDHLLLAGDALAEAERWAEEHLGQLSPVEKAFLDASRAHRERARRQARAKRLQRVRIVSASMLGFVLAVTAAAIYTVQRDRSRQYASESATVLDTDPVEALRMALEAARWPLLTDEEAYPALTSAFAASHVRAILSPKQGAGPVRSVDLSPDGQLAVTVSGDGIARTWNTVTGEQAAFGAHVVMARFSPDGSRIVTADSGGATLWDVEGHRLRTLAGRADGVRSARWSPDGSRIAAASADGTVLVWDAETGGSVVLASHQGAVKDAQWNRDGSRIATTGSDRRVLVWDAGTGSQLASSPPGQIIVTPAVFSPDGRYVIVDTSEVITYVWEWGTTGQPLMELPGGKPMLSGDGRYLLTVRDDKVEVWDGPAGGPKIAEMAGHEGRVTVATFNHDGSRIVTGGEDGTVRIWDAATGAGLVVLHGHHGTVNDAAVSPTQPDPARLVVVTAGEDGTVFVWDPAIGPVFSGYPSWLSSASFSADGNLVVGAGAYGVARVWPSQGGAQLAQLHTGHLEPLTSAAFSADGRYVVAGGGDGIVRIWDWRAGSQPVASMPAASDGEVSAVAFDPSGKLVVIAGPGNAASVWEWAAGTAARPLGEHDDPVTDAAFGANGTVVTASRDGTARIWDVASGQLQSVLTGHDGAVSSAVFSRDGRFIVTTGEDKTARIWDVTSGVEQRLLRSESEVQNAAFSPDGSYIATGASDGTMEIWETETGRRLALLMMHSKEILSSRFSPNQTDPSILTASKDGTARIYHCQICAPLATVRERAEHRQPLVSR